MTWRSYLFLFALGFIVLVGVAYFQSLPGYLDSDYYFAGGLQLVRGNGFYEPYLWNYLDDPEGIPHPSHTYWLPLSSMLAAVSMLVTGEHSYAGARILFMLIAALIPVLTAALSMDVTGKRPMALVSGLLAVFSIYYLPFLPVTDNYGIYMLLGGLIFLHANRRGRTVSLLFGLLAGLMNLARSDGLLWLGLTGLLVLWRVREQEDTFVGKASNIIREGFLVIVGYLVIMGPWYARNMATIGSLLPPGGGRLLWLTNYNDTFAFPADRVNMQSWLDAGWGEALKTRLWALRFNALNTFAAQGGILLFPFIVIGLWQVRRSIRARLAITGWSILLVVVTLVFPFAGARGTFFHAASAFQPFWWALAPLGLERIVDLVRQKNLLTDHAYFIFRGSLVGISILLSGIILWLRVIQPGWQPEEELYIKVDKLLVERGASIEERVIVRNPPGYYLVSGRAALAMPPGGPDVILSLARRYNADYFILEPGGVLKEYQELYDSSGKGFGMQFIGEANGARIYAIESDK